MTTYILDKKLLNILNIQDQEYSYVNLDKILRTKLTKKNANSQYYIIKDELKTYLNYHKDWITMSELINIITINFSIRKDYPNCKYLSYDQKPNYDLL